MSDKAKSKEFYCKECFKTFDNDEVVAVFLDDKGRTLCQECAKLFPEDKVTYKEVKTEEEDR